MPDIWKIHVWLNLLAKQAEVMTAQLYWPFMYRNEKKKQPYKLKNKQKNPNRTLCMQLNLNTILTLILSFFGRSDQI